MRTDRQTAPSPLNEPAKRQTDPHPIRKGLTSRSGAKRRQSHRLARRRQGSPPIKNEGQGHQRLSPVALLVIREIAREMAQMDHQVMLHAADEVEHQKEGDCSP